MSSISIHTGKERVCSNYRKEPEGVSIFLPVVRLKFRRMFTLTSWSILPSAINGDSLYFPRSFVCENELDSVWKLRVTSCCKLKKKRKKERENRDNSPIRPRFLFPPLLARIIVDLRHRFCQRPRARAHVALSEQENKTDLSQREMPSPLPSLVGVYRTQYVYLVADTRHYFQ